MAPFSQELEPPRIPGRFIFAGLASTVCIPAIAWLTATTGWRWTHGAMAVAIIAGALVMEIFVLPVLGESRSVQRTTAPQSRSRPPRIPLLVNLTFGLSTLAAMTLSALLIVALIDRGRSSTAAANALAWLGIMQLPGRLWILSGRHSGSVPMLLAGPLILQAIGLTIVAVSEGLIGVGIGVALFGVGSGWNTLARPLVVQALFGTEQAGHLNGSIARLQGFARAVGPLAAAMAYRTFGYTALFAGTAGLLVMVLIALAVTHRSAAG